MLILSIIKKEGKKHINFHQLYFTIYIFLKNYVQGFLEFIYIEQFSILTHIISLTFHILYSNQLIAKMEKVLGVKLPRPAPKKEVKE